MSAARCDDLHAFFDGELPAANAEQFREHLGVCARCQRELHHVMQLQAVSSDLAAEERAAGNVVDIAAATRKRRPWLRTLSLAAGGLAAAAAAVLVVLPKRDANPFNLGDTRSIEARLTHAGAREWKPYAVKRSSEGEWADLPLTSLAQLEQRGDYAGVAVGHLLRGERDAAARLLAKAPRTADTKSDQAAVALSRGNADEALLLLDGILVERPGHPQALWNRALALRELGLPLASAEAFSEVVKLREPGWAEEAAQRASSLSAEAAREQASFKAARGAADAMMRGGPPVPDELARQHPGMVRGYFYESLRSAQSVERVRALRPVARALDAAFGGMALQRLVERAEVSDFSRRAPLAARYHQLAIRKLDPAGVAALLADTKDAGFSDIRIGVLWNARAAAENLDEYRRLAADLGDPWFVNIGMQEAAKKEKSQLEAERKLRDVQAHAVTHRLEGRALGVVLDLVTTSTTLLRPDEQWSRALEVQRTARRLHEHNLEQSALYQLATAARLRHASALARAYLREAALREPSNCAVQRYVHLGLADMYQVDLRAADVRRELLGVATCNAPPDRHELNLRADVARLDPQPGDLDTVRRQAAALRSNPTISLSDKLLVDVFEARLLIDTDRAAGSEALQKAIAAADAAGPSAVEAQHARTWAYMTLALDAAKAGKFAESVALLAADARVPAPARCAVALAVDDARSVMAVLPAQGEPAGVYDSARREAQWKWAPKVTGTLLDGLRGCDVVDVIARPPAQGRADILPAGMAWRHRLGGGQVLTRAAPRRLVIDDVEPPAALHLARLAPAPSRPADSNLVELRGPAATPSRALAAMRDATEIEIHAHGVIDGTVSDAALVVLSPDADGSYALTVRDLADTRLQAAPVVTLAACRGARQGHAFHVGASLPAAFLRAGARAVLAAQTDVQDAQARPFFDAVRTRMQRGAAPAAALRDERLAWAGKPGAQWAHDVVLFE